VDPFHGAAAETRGDEDVRREFVVLRQFGLGKADAAHCSAQWLAGRVTHYGIGSVGFRNMDAKNELETQKAVRRAASKLVYSCQSILHGAFTHVFPPPFWSYSHVGTNVFCRFRSISSVYCSRGCSVAPRRPRSFSMWAREGAQLRLLARNTLSTFMCIWTMRQFEERWS